MVHPSSADSRGRISLLGARSPDSHIVTIEEERNPTLLASSPCVSPAFCRNSRILKQVFIGSPPFLTEREITI